MNQGGSYKRPGALHPKGRRGRGGRGSSTRRQVRYANYSSLRNPLPPPPRGQVWHHNKETREWTLVQKQQDPLLQPAAAPGSSGELNGEKMAMPQGRYKDDAESTVVFDHIVLPTDTFSGLCLTYGITATKLRQANCFSGTSLKLAPKKLRIPVSTEKLRSGRIQPQNQNSDDCKQQALLADFPSLHPSEARSYLAVADGNLEDATQQAHLDGVSSFPTTPIQHLMKMRQKHQQPDETTSSYQMQVISMDQERVYGCRIVAPVDLPADFCFVVSLPASQNSETMMENGRGQGKDCHVKVPDGGVTKGETFTPILCHVDQDDDDELPIYYPPIGAWKDGLCSCLDRGLLAPENVMGCCCQPTLLGQVQTRNGFGCCGGSAKEAQAIGCSCSAYAIWTTIAVIAMLFAAIVVMAYVDITKYSPPDLLGDASWVILLLVAIGLTLWQAMIWTRQSIRQRFAIPGSAADDCICAGCLPCCALTQMARHTANYNETPAAFYSKTGLPQIWTPRHLSPDSFQTNTIKGTTRTASIGKISDEFVVWEKDFDDDVKKDKMKRDADESGGDDGGTIATADETFAGASSASFVEADDYNDHGRVVDMAGFEIETGMNVILEHQESGDNDGSDDSLQIV